MKTKQTLRAAVILGATLLTATGVQAALVSQLGGQAVYDTDLNITWLANANLAATNTFGVSGISPAGNMTWDTAQQWIAAMNAANYLGYSDWRLPTTTVGIDGCTYSNNGTLCGYNSTGSEMAHLYYNELGNLGYHSTSGLVNNYWGLANTDAFSNLQSDYYWSGTEYASNTGYAYFFNFYDGYQLVNYKNYVMHALAVRPGQVAAVPVPGAAWLLGSGLLGLIGIAKRKIAYGL